ncbi:MULTISPECIES: GtrA family protein [unclassified Arthrobacter]|uniref:GtrA family protein n=1 Tax=unclassified Arthrobacter TaxID=235627 RepID=UPI001D13F302|nr:MULTISPECIES: GtrA family protein [unclassified Arthrobacter]MCC3276866.1 GtrA family protein [Arthrobacter sp. zg-Y20]MCC9176106.1 GtrA family protein [Arthrobacter sp. zg-Y750]MDK1317027.1 GtrA family protein [Arthrobacter sp. zg.Y20]WIB05262.1 GtrA family protein [Arthrobacter sp. zg-Y20]
MPQAPRNEQHLSLRILRHRTVKFLAVGGFSFIIDLGLLVLLHEVGNLDLWVATPIAFIVSLVFNFLMQRSFTFRSTHKPLMSLLKYLLLVALNVAATDIIVNWFAGAGLGYSTGKVVSTVATMVWNYFIYKYWIFPAASPDRRPLVADILSVEAAPYEGGYGHHDDAGRRA